MAGSSVWGGGSYTVSGLTTQTLVMGQGGNVEAGHTLIITAGNDKNTAPTCTLSGTATYSTALTSVTSITAGTGNAARGTQVWYAVVLAAGTCTANFTLAAVPGMWEASEWSGETTTPLEATTLATSTTTTFPTHAANTTGQNTSIQHLYMASGSGIEQLAASTSPWVGYSDQGAILGGPGMSEGSQVGVGSGLKLTANFTITQGGSNRISVIFALTEIADFLFPQRVPNQTVYRM